MARPRTKACIVAIGGRTRVSIYETIAIRARAKSRPGVSDGNRCQRN